MWVRVLGAGVVVKVWDSDLTPPSMHEQGLMAESSRGLFLVAMLCRQWGYYWPVAGGKVAWGKVALANGDEHGETGRSKRL